MAVKKDPDALSKVGTMAANSEKPRLTLYQDIHNALKKVPPTKKEPILSAAAQSAYLKLSPEERQTIDTQASKLRPIKGVGEYTALEILAALGRLLDR